MTNGFTGKKKTKKKRWTDYDVISTAAKNLYVSVRTGCSGVGCDYGGLEVRPCTGPRLIRLCRADYLDVN